MNFYQFLNTLDGKLDSIEKRLVDKSSLTNLEKDVDAKLNEQKRHISKQDDFTDDLRQIRQVESKVSDLQAKNRNTKGIWYGAP